MSSYLDKILFKAEVDKLLLNLREILLSKNFKASTNLLIIQKKKNKEFLLENNFGHDDVVKVLLELKTENYMKSVLDNKNIQGLYLHEFAIKYDDIKYTYVKFKIQDNNLVIRVISFHKNEYDVFFPYS